MGPALAGLPLAGLAPAGLAPAGQRQAWPGKPWQPQAMGSRARPLAAPGWAALPLLPVPAGPIRRPVPPLCAPGWVADCQLVSSPSQRSIKQPHRQHIALV